ncbi:DUF1489 domain-containing protein [Asticcacaulis excentricus]|uniref:DUF1489 family protein n=1 Tax=Asticcacaulis excentricus TaxID=78587 RepID=A0A3G9G5U3_9CAUL|nr:DUF1489 domain-containing protein [Asticcacaulis excentricus]BBF80364.1 hypothetical protein EM6_0944 [Asticcacaulis excentricus]
MSVNLVKLCVGADTVDDLRRWEQGHKTRTIHTRQTPKRAEELLDGGSLYWVIKGVILVRRPIVAIDTVEGDLPQCLITVSTEHILTEPQPRRPFQGWRYLEVKDSPRDLPQGAGGEALPADLIAALRDAGAW